MNKFFARLPAKADKLPVFKLLIPLYIIIAAVFAVLIHNGSLQLLEPAGYIADIQSKILWGVVIFAAVVGTIMISAFFMVVFRFRENNHRRYAPDWTASPPLQAAGWGFLILVISLISVMVWDTAHLVDPFRPISSTVKPITIQVVALQWKWLFLYPNDHLATVNEVVLPVGVPVEFQLTADAPMNSFWIPRLSGQVYAMTGMITQLHVRADQAGTYMGSPNEISGSDYAGMYFAVKAVQPSAYESWKAQARHSTNILDYASYKQLAKPSSYLPAAEYTLKDDNLFEVVVMQFMEPGVDPSTLQIRGANI